MTIIGEAFVAISPESAGFAGKLQTQLQSGLSKVGLANVGQLAGAAVVVAFGAALFKIGGQFGAVNRQLQQETGATGAVLGQLGDTVKRTFAQVPESLTQVTAAVSELQRRGVPLGKTFDDLARKTVEFAHITHGEVAPLVESTTSLFAKFNVPLHDQSRLLDVLFKAQQASGKTLQELIDPLQSGGAALQQFGFGLEKSAALIAGLQRAGVNVQPALAGLRKGFATIAKEGGDPQKALQGLIAEFRAGQDPTKAMADAIKLFGSRSGVELATAIKAGKFNVDALLKSITSGKGGILDTAAATRTLGDRFQLMIHGVLLALAPLATAFRKGISEQVSAAAPAIGELARALGHLGIAIGPALAPIGIGLVAALHAALPLISAAAVGIESISSVLGHVPAPVLAAVAVLATLAFGLYSVGGAAGAAVLGLELLEGATALLTNPVFLVVAGVVALGAAVKIFGSHADDGGKRAKEFGQALFDTQDQTRIFAAGVDNADQAISKLLRAQIAAGKNQDLTEALSASGTTVNDLAKAVTAGGAAWEAYKAKLRAGLTASGQIDFFIRQSIRAVEDQRKAFITAARTELETVVSTDQLTKAQVNQIIQTDRNRDGTVNWAKALDDTAAAIAGQVEKQDKLAAKTAVTATSYAELARQVALGTITADDGAVALEGLGFSAAGAKDQFKVLEGQVKAFVDASISALPTVGSAIDQFTGDIKSASQQLASDRDEQARLQQQFADQAASSSASGRSRLAKIGDQIAQDQQRIRNGEVLNTTKLTSDLNRQALIQQEVARSSGTSSASLARSIEENNQRIRDDYAKLAADSDPATFTKNVIKNALDVASFFSNIKRLVDEGFGLLAGELAKKGPEAAAGLAQGLASDPAKARIAQGALEASNTVTSKYKQFLEQHFPELTGTGGSAGEAIGRGIAKGILDILSKKFPELKLEGTSLGAAISDGVADGIRGSRKKVGDAFLAVIDGAVQVVKGALHIKSPSRVTMRIGEQVGEGFAVGILSQSGRVSDALGALAAQSSASFSRQTSEAFRRSGTAAGSAFSRSISRSVLEELRHEEAIRRELERIANRFSGGPQLPPGAVRPPSQVVTQHPTLLSSGLLIPGEAAALRADALEQQRQANLKLQDRGPLFRDIVVQEKTDPLHLAAQLAFQFRSTF